MGLGFRFLPGQTEFLMQELQLPESFERLSFLSHSLSSSYNFSRISLESLLPYSCSGVGLRGLVSDNLNKILVEVITYYDGTYGRFLVLVCLGIGCTVWYNYAPGTSDRAPDSNVFTPLESYEPYFYSNFYSPVFRKLDFVETHDVTALVDSILGNEEPFTDIRIPASGPVLKSVGLGLMVTLFLAVGLLPKNNLNS